MKEYNGLITSVKFSTTWPKIGQDLIENQQLLYEIGKENWAQDVE